MPRSRLVRRGLAGLPGMLTVTLGGSRASGLASAASDRGFAIYYRRSFDPSFLRNKGLRAMYPRSAGGAAG